MRGLRGAVSFLTPAGGAAVPTPSALAWFPAVGAATGAAVGGIWWMAGRAWPPLVTAGIAVVADLVFTGLLHVDGLCDTTDGLLPVGMDVRRRLEIMAAPDVGAFGVAACTATLVLRWAALAAIRPDVILLAGLWAASRAAMAVVVITMPYARPEGGLATAFRGGRRTPVVAGGALTAVALAATGHTAALIGFTAGAVTVVAFAWRRLGGFTGDVLGAAGVVGETLGLLAACARW